MYQSPNDNFSINTLRFVSTHLTYHAIYLKEKYCQIGVNTNLHGKATQHSFIHETATYALKHLGNDLGIGLGGTAHLKDRAAR